jgi:hypothetical protein
MNMHVAYVNTEPESAVAGLQQAMETLLSARLWKMAVSRRDFCSC